MQVKRLICVEVDNLKTGVAQSNKFYNMTEVGNGTFKVEYGRVGKTHMIQTYSMREWNKILKSKLKKYDDVTDLHEIKESVDVDMNIDNSEVRKLIEMLQRFSSQHVKKNYNISADKVTPAMIERAQEILNNLPSYLNDKNIKDLNDSLLNLYKTIPRQMKNVKDYLVSDLQEDSKFKAAVKLIENEQETLDTMESQMKIQQSMLSTAEVKEQISFLDNLGLDVTLADKSEIDKIKSMLGDQANRFSKLYRVGNLKTEKRYVEDKEAAKHKDELLLFHGSRNQNWLSIMMNGLMIRPSGAIHTGSMFSDGIYFADKSRKAIGYSSLSGSYWARGNDNVAYLAVYAARVGNQKHIYKHDSSCYQITKSKINKDGFDSVFAHGGIDLINNEFIVYDQVQCTIKYLIEIK